MENFDVYARIEYLTNELNRLTELYDKGIPEISDKEWDDMYFELQALEHEFGYTLPNSPTQKVNYTIVNELQKIKHNHPMLSLDKTKNIEEIKSFVGNKDWIAMLKMDGLTCSLLYENGRLVRAETRGDGEIGEDVTHNAMVIPSIPKRILYTERLVVDGEIICKLDDFKEFEVEYKNSRNFAAGSIRLLDSNECAKRKLTFVAWDVIGKPKSNSLWAVLSWLYDLSFTVVPVLHSSYHSVEDTMCLKQIAANYNYPIDGFVFKLDNPVEYELMGRTDHHFCGGLAYKFYDDIYETKLTDIEWSLGKTGVLTPTAKFNTVQIDGCDVSSASLHNISIIKKLGLTNNCTVYVSKRNEIIPQIESCLSDGDSTIIAPKHCPVCGAETEVVIENKSEVLMCKNVSCLGKMLARFTFFVSKPAMNIDELGEATLAFLINKGWIKSFKDIYHLYTCKDEWEKCEGFGKKSVANILESIDRSRFVALENFICALSIDGVGKSVSKTISRAFNGSFAQLLSACRIGYDFSELEDIGNKIHENISKYFKENEMDIVELADEVMFVESKTQQNNASLTDITFCITGTFPQSREVLKERLEAKGAKFVSGVSKKTSVLFCGESAGSKLAKAQKLGVKIMNYDELIKLLED